MNPAWLDDMSWAMAEVYASCTDRILVNLAHYFPFVVPGGSVPGAWEYQARMLAQMGQVNRETAAIIASYLGGADQALQDALRDAILEGLKSEEPALRRAAADGFLTTPARPQVEPGMMQAFQSYYRQSADRLNLVNTVMLESTQAAYTATVADIANRIQATQSVLNVAAGEVVTGVSTFNQALHTAVGKMVDNGLTGFIGHAGRRWSPEAYVAMDIRTTMANTARSAVWERNQEYGNDLYLVSSHDGARPLCYPWQGKIISTTGRTGTTTDLDGNTYAIHSEDEIESFRYGGGLFGVNCGHYPMVWIPGFSTMKGKPQDEEANEKQYEESQQQRALERKLREEKRDLDVMRAQGAPEEQIRAQRERVRNASADIDDFCEETGRTRRRDREGVPVRATWPDPDTYDPATFPTEERDRILGGMRNGQPGAVVQATPEPFVPAKTRAEAEAYAREHFARDVDYSGMSVQNANAVNEALTDLTRQYPIEQLDHVTQQSQGSVARANYSHLEINGKKLGKILEEAQANFVNGQAATRNELEQLRARFAGRTRLPPVAQKAVDRLERELRYSRWSVINTHDDHIRAVIAHEYGHILSDQYFGMINQEYANPHYLTDHALRSMNDRWQAVFTRAIQSGDIYSLSQYGSKNVREFFAESFAARFMGETLPDYVEELMAEVLRNGIM